MFDTAKHVIEVDAATDFIMATEIVNRIAAILAPVPSTGGTKLVRLEKRHRISEGRFSDSELTPGDWKQLDAIWDRLPPVSQASAEQFQEYNEAFNLMPNKPEWALVPQFQNSHDLARAENSRIRIEHAMLIDAAIKSNSLKARTDTRAPATKLWVGVLVAIEDARAYLAPMGFELQVAASADGEPTRSTTTPSTLQPKGAESASVASAWDARISTTSAAQFSSTRESSGEQPAGTDWKESARAIADELFDHDTNSVPSTRDCLIRFNTRRDAVGGYAVRTMEKMKERGIKGPRGTIINANTVSREALQGPKWWASKQK